MGANEKGFKKRVLIPALTEQGFTVRNASSMIDVIFESVKDALLRHERVELPIGTFEVVTNAKPRIWRFGKVIVRSEYRLVFVPDAELYLAAAASPGSPPRPKRKKKVIKSELDICVELIVDFVRDHIADRQMFFAELWDSPCLPGMFKRARPEPADIRPLDQAKEVIAEFKPKTLPANQFDSHYACVDWFAHWSQRVIPLHLWQKALQQAKRILLP